MPTDYDALRRQNIRDYGEATHHLELLGNLYPDRTHFLFELLQNAEDADATTVTFSLRPDVLELTHDGRPFSDADVRGICGVGEGTKNEDLTRIGRFGVGFKAVYAYTRTPEIHSDDEHFVVEHYVRPRGVAAVPGVPEGHTRFRFPFDHAEISPSRAVQEIGDALAALDGESLLFLRNIGRITWSAPDGRVGTLRRTESNGLRGTDTGRVVTVEVECNDPGVSEAPSAAEPEPWLVFDRAVPDPADGTRTVGNVEIAIAVEPSDHGGWAIVGLDASNLSVFFPTEKETHLGFLIQGPYRTTPARDNVPADDEWNRTLVELTAELMEEVLTGLRERGLLTTPALELFPHQPERFPPDSMFRPLFDRFAELVRTRDLLPAHAGGHVAGSQAVLARGGALRDLFEPDDLAELLGGLPRRWVDATLTFDQARDLVEFVENCCGALELDAPRVAAALDAEFLARRDDEWLARLYRLLSERQQMLRRLAAGSGPLADVPLFRLEDGTHVPLRRADGQPAVYLPGETTSDFPTLRRTLYELTDARSFCATVEIPKVDPVAEVLEHVLPRYAQREHEEMLDPDAMGPEALLQDVATILDAASTARGERQDELLRELRQTPFLLGDFDGARRFARPSELYRSTPDLQTYLSGSSDRGLLADLYGECADRMHLIGVAEQVRIQARRADRYGYVPLVDRHGYHERGVDGFDPEVSIDGLDHALSHPTLERSRIVWDILRRNHQRLVGIVETSRHAGFGTPQREEQVAEVLEIATSARWLPDRDGLLHRPSELSLDDLDATFTRDDQLAKILGMVPAAVAELSERAGIPSEVLRDMLDPEFLAEVLELRKRHSRKTSSSPIQEDGFTSAATSSFTKGGVPHLGEPDNDPPLGDSPVGAPERRRARVADQIVEDQAAGPDEPTTRVSRRRSFEKDPAARAFLVEQYAGRCQICDDGFSKRNGEPYVEAIALVPTRGERWADRPGNLLGLCAGCAARFVHGTVEAEGLIDLIRTRRLAAEGDDRALAFPIVLCGEERRLRYTERHLLDLQELLRAADGATGATPVDDGGTEDVSNY